MLIWIAIAILIALGFGSFIVLLAATAITGRAVEFDSELQEQPLEQWAAGNHDSVLSVAPD